MSSYLEMWKKVVWAGAIVVLVWANLHSAGIIDLNLAVELGWVEPKPRPFMFGWFD